MKIFWIVLSLLLPICMAGGHCEETDLPNILIISLDGGRFDHFSCCGYSLDTTPNIDKLAKEGVLFKQVVIEKNRPASGAAGLPPSFEVLGGSNALDLNSLIKRIEEYKNKRFLLYYQWKGLCLPYNPPEPYDTMFFPKNYIMTRMSLVNLDVIRKAASVQRWRDATPARKAEFLKNFDPTKAPVKGAGAEFFYGFADLEPEDAVPVRALYDGDLRWTDDLVGRVIAKLKELGLYDKTVLVITADNTEELRIINAGNAPEGGMIIRYPKLIPPDTVIASRVKSIDLFPTLFDMMGITIPKTYEGKSLLPLIEDEKKMTKGEI